MTQMLLFNDLRPTVPQTQISRNKDELVFPESIYTTPHTHGLHRFPGKYIPNIPRYLLMNYLSHSDRPIFDPFCGSGTTLVEAAIQGRRFIGIDIDPLGVLISTVKTTPLQHNELDIIENHWRGFTPAITGKYLPPIETLSHWFSDTAIQELSALKAHCLKLSGDLQKFSLVVFSSIIRRVSNADDQTQKTYVSHTLHKNPPLPSRLFPIHLGRALGGMRAYLQTAHAEGTVALGDARELVRIGDVDIITSPPYIDSIDYPYNQMLEYFWLMPELGINALDGFRQLRKAPMGFRHSNLSDELIFERLTIKHRRVLSRSHKKINSISKKEATNVISFFKDFALHIDSAAKCQKKGARYCLVIGRSVVRGVEIPTAEFLSDIICHSGYILLDKMHYQIRRHYMKFPRRSNSGKIVKDHILVFERG